MKNLLSIIGLSAFISVTLFACKNREAGISTAGPSIKYEDTVGLPQFQSWKAMNERARFEEYMNNQAAQVATAAPAIRKSRATASRMTSRSTHYASAKRGWSKAAKYAAIGGGSGMVLGAVINKRNRVAGGAVGAVLGGGLGYILGRARDKKEGRY